MPDRTSLTATVGGTSLVAAVALVVGPALPGLALPVLMLLVVAGAAGAGLRHALDLPPAQHPLRVPGDVDVDRGGLLLDPDAVAVPAGRLPELTRTATSPATRSARACRCWRRHVHRLAAAGRPRPAGGDDGGDRVDSGSWPLPARKLIAENRKARHDFHIVERVEAGIALTGTEVKSLRDGGGNIRESYAQLRNGEVFLVGANIAPYRQGNLQNHEPMRDRKLLLHRREIHQLGVKVAQRGMTLVPLALYLTNGKVKLELGLARGKEGVDKRHSIAERDARRQMERAIKERNSR